MYTLLSGLYKYMFQKDEYCVLILGLDNAGKTVNEATIWFFFTTVNSLHWVLCLVLSSTLFVYMLCFPIFFPFVWYFVGLP